MEEIMEEDLPVITVRNRHDYLTALSHAYSTGCHVRLERKSDIKYFCAPEIHNGDE